MEVGMRWKLKWQWYCFLNWLEAQEPIFCAHCGNLAMRKNTSLATLLTGITVRLCKKCAAKWFGEK
jgi:hypothetical protein